jgi:hypothetical protein
MNMTKSSLSHTRRTPTTSCWTSYSCFVSSWLPFSGDKLRLIKPYSFRLSSQGSSVRVSLPPNDKTSLLSRVRLALSLQPPLIVLLNLSLSFSLPLSLRNGFSIRPQDRELHAPAALPVRARTGALPRARPIIARPCDHRRPPASFHQLDERILHPSASASSSQRSDILFSAAAEVRPEEGQSPALHPNLSPPPTGPLPVYDLVR